VRRGSLVGAPALHDDPGSAPHQPGIDALSLCCEVKLELDDRRDGQPGEVPGQSLGALALALGRCRGVLDQRPEIFKLHVRKLSVPCQTSTIGKSVGMAGIPG